MKKFNGVLNVAAAAVVVAMTSSSPAVAGWFSSYDLYKDGMTDDLAAIHLSIPSVKYDVSGAATKHASDVAAINTALTDAETKLKNLKTETDAGIAYVRAIEDLLAGKAVNTKEFSSSRLESFCSQPWVKQASMSNASIIQGIFKAESDNFKKIEDTLYPLALNEWKQHIDPSRPMTADPLLGGGVEESSAVDKDTKKIAEAYQRRQWKLFDGWQHAKWAQHRLSLAAKAAVGSYETANTDPSRRATEANLEAKRLYTSCWNSVAKIKLMEVANKYKQTVAVGEDGQPVSQTVTQPE